MLLLAVLVAAIEATPVPVPAPAPPMLAIASQPVDPARRAAALRLLDANEFDRQSVSSSTMMAKMATATMSRQLEKRYGSALPAGLLDELSALISTEVIAAYRAELPNIRSQAADSYARHFTEAELLHMVELARDPVLIKQRALGETMRLELAYAGETAMRRHEAEMQVKIKDLVERRFKEKKVTRSVS